MSQGRGLHNKRQDWVLLMTKIYLQETRRWKREKPRKNTKAHSQTRTQENKHEYINHKTKTLDIYNKRLSLEYIIKRADCR
jgi:hypothetical protein